MPRCLVRLAALGSSILLAACSSPAVALDAPNVGRGPASDRPLPALADAVRVWDARASLPLELDELLERLAATDVVFLGETHLDDTTHRVEAAVLEGLLERRAGRVVLSLEMFERDVQPALDRYLVGELDEQAFLAAARPWKNYRTDYRPLVEMARAAGIPVVAANAPSALRRKVSSGGRSALDGLSAEERALMPAEILPADARYWERVDRATRGHMNFASQPEEQRLYSGQNLWDNSMGDACARALREHPGHAVLHVVGGFHVMYGAGTAAQLRARAPEAGVAVVEILTAPGLHAARPERDAERADYLVYATELARSLSDGFHAVSVPGELRYTIDVPADASAAAPAPLLVWLPDGGERVEDARELLRAALGDEVALAVVEPPHPDLAEDLAPGGRWSRPASFRADHAQVQHALEQLVEYVTRRFPVSAEGLVVAGRGHGATALLWSAQYSEWLAARCLAIAPRGAGALRLEGLPERSPATRELRLLVLPEGEPEASALLADFQALGTPAELALLASDRPLERQVEDALRAALGLAARAPADLEPVLCVLERDLARARQWAEVHARRLERGGRPARVVTAAELTGEEDPARLQRLEVGGHWPLSSFAEGRGLPLAPGDFGGTTVLVVPAGADPEPWLALERDKALKKRSPFAGLRVARSDAEPGLAAVVAALEQSGARSVLVVPAAFCASPQEMQALRASLGGAGGELELAWLPGLGGELCCAPAGD
jgi:uncharacterized iron-regulated protein